MKTSRIILKQSVAFPDGNNAMAVQYSSHARKSVAFLLDILRIMLSLSVIESKSNNGSFHQ